jgi:hypothetical protein
MSPELLNLTGLPPDGLDEPANCGVTSRPCPTSTTSSSAYVAPLALETFVPALRDPTTSLGLDACTTWTTWLKKTSRDRRYRQQSPSQSAQYVVDTRAHKPQWRGVLGAVAVTNARLHSAIRPRLWPLGRSFLAQTAACAEFCRVKRMSRTKSPFLTYACKLPITDNEKKESAGLAW